MASVQMESLQQEMADLLTANIKNGDRYSWNISAKKMSALMEWVSSYASIPDSKMEKWTDALSDSLDSYSTKRAKKLSPRVWDLSEQFRQEIELSVEAAMEEGMSADDLSMVVRKYLKEPERLFRRVRDKSGVLRLSKAAKAYHPGAGIYRSSYKNARRMTVTEINAAYREADHLRWKTLPFVKGVEIRLTDSRHVPDICDDLKGVYPKDFKFTGWHPWCRCYAVPVLPSVEEFGDWDGESGFPDEVTDTPEAFDKWVADNRERIENAKAMPSFLDDNRKFWEGKKASGKEDGLETVAKAVGVEVGKPMTFEEADMKHPNPHYNKGGMYASNCQSTAVAYELRRRGLPVEAFGNNKTEWYMPYELGKRPEAAWVTKEGTIPTPKIVKDKINAASLGDSMKEEGRYQLWFNWNGQNKGHVITAERLADGSLRYYDAQSGKSASDFLFDFARLDTAEGVCILKMDGLRPNENLMNGIVKAAKSKAKAPKMTMEQISRWLENAQGASSFMGDFEPYSDEILKRLKDCKTKAQRNNLLESVAHGKNATTINDNGKAFTAYYQKHRSMKGNAWKNTKQMAIDLNNGGISVCFLPEYEDKISADAIVKVEGSWRLADFKCSQSVKSNTIATDVKHAFEQAEICILKVTNADKGIICDVLDYLKRKNIKMNGFTFVNKFGKCKNITKEEIKREKYRGLLKGFF